MSRLLRLDLPDDVWDRLNAEAGANNKKIGAYLKGLVLHRDAVRQRRLSEAAAEAEQARDSSIPGSTENTQQERQEP